MSVYTTNLCLLLLSRTINIVFAFGTQIFIIYCVVCSSTNIHPEVRQAVISSFPHHGHSGIVEAARDLFMQIEVSSRDDGN